MLPRRLRLSRRSFPDGRLGNKASSPHFSLICGPTTLPGGASAVVSKKVARRSVDRHLLKRRMLSVIREWASPRRFLVVYAKSGSPSLSYEALRRELSGLLQSALRHG